MYLRFTQLRSSDVVKSYIARIQEVNPYINAVVEDRFKEALHEAYVIDNFISNNEIGEDELKKKKPLLGVPLTVKESCRLKGSKNI